MTEPHTAFARTAGANDSSTALVIDELAPDDVVAVDDVLAPYDVFTPDDVLAPEDVLAPDEVLAPHDVVAPEDVLAPENVVAPENVLAPDDVFSPQDVGAVEGDSGREGRQLRGSGDQRVGPRVHFRSEPARRDERIRRPGAGARIDGACQRDGAAGVDFTRPLRERVGPGKRR